MGIFLGFFGYLSVAFVIYGYKVYEEYVVGYGVYVKEFYLEGGEYAFGGSGVSGYFR